MHKPEHTKQGRAIIAFALTMLFIPGPTLSLDKGNFPPPSMEGFVKTSEEDADGDGNAIRETHIVHYFNNAGDRVFSMTTKGKLWAWSRQSHASEDPARNYVIRDSNCDSMFDERYGLDDEFNVPECLK